MLIAWVSSVKARLWKWKDGILSLESAADHDLYLRSYELEFWETTLSLYLGLLVIPVFTEKNLYNQFSACDDSETAIMRVAEAAENVLKLHQQS